MAEGDGPVNALDGAARGAGQVLSALKNVQLTDYKVRILESSTGTGARTRVLIQSTDGKDEWGTVGVNDNIIEASLQALVDSMEYALMQEVIYTCLKSPRLTNRRRSKRSGMSSG